MSASSSVRATLAQAEARATDDDVRAIVLLVRKGRLLLIVGEPADVAELPAGLRALAEACLLDRELCPRCGCHAL